MPLHFSLPYIRSGNLKANEKMQILAENVNHDQARTIEAQLIRDEISDSGATLNLSVKDQLDMSGLRNKNRGRDLDKRPFNPKTMGGDYSSLDTPKDVHKKNCYAKK